MAIDRAMTLFGLDLGRAIKFVQMGWQQALGHPDSWIVRKYEPEVFLWEGEKYCARYQASKRGAEAVVPPDDAILAVRVPDDVVLFKTLRLPEKQEIFIDQMVQMDAIACSPFAESETRFGWRVVYRGNGELQIVLAITAQAQIDDCLLKINQQFEQGKPEIWAITPQGHVIEFLLSDESPRKVRLRSRLRSAARQVAVIWLAVLTTLLIPAAMTTLRANEVAVSLAESKEIAKDAVAVRDQLQLQRERYRTIFGELRERTNYHFWLNHIATSTPDSVYFSGVSMEGKEVVVNGFAANAADYLGALTQESAYKNVAAASAFVRDGRSGLERLTISWTLQAE